MFKTIEHYINKHKLINKNDTIIIGLSGGPDSVFLLHTLKALSPEYNLTLVAAHLNHEWRKEADAEEELCYTIAKSLGISFVSAKLSSLSPIKKYNGSKEEFARHMRRQFLENTAREHNAQRIALGHHAQDQQETFFIRLIRGTSLSGLTGMQPQSGLYIRPLLETNKADIIAHLDEHNIAYATDMSNESPDYLRNRIRALVIPALQECDARWNNNFLTTINRLTQENDFLDEMAATALRSLITIVNHKESLDTKQFINTHPALHRRIIIQWLIHNKVQFPTTQAFLDEVIRFLLHERGGVHVVHDEWSIVKKQNKVYIVRK